MTIHSLMVVKNEGDVIDYTLRRAVEWSDRIYVFDTGSRDDTWEAVQAAARRHAAIVPFRRETRPFNDSLRGELFRQFRAEAGADAWWCRLDGDEVYVDDPRDFLAAVPAPHHVVWAAQAQFYFTAADVARFAPDGPAPKIDEGNRPRFYLTNSSEPRFFRHRPRLAWSHGAWPAHVGLVHPRRILQCHFQWRSPQQIQLRLDTRRAAAASGCSGFEGSQQQHWQAQVRDAGALRYDDGIAPLQIDEGLMPGHLEPSWQRVIKRGLHGTRIWP